jgi:hypothetical protein
MLLTKHLLHYNEMKLPGFNAGVSLYAVEELSKNSSSFLLKSVTLTKFHIISSSPQSYLLTQLQADVLG